MMFKTCNSRFDVIIMTFFIQLKLYHVCTKPWIALLLSMKKTYAKHTQITGKHDFLWTVMRFTFYFLIKNRKNNMYHTNIKNNNKYKIQK